MDDFKYLCPVCRTKGNTTFLCLRQINLTTAVYLCKDIRCSYPKGYSWKYVNKNLFNDNDDQCDSDSSDSVDDDIERIENSSKEDCKLKPNETRNHDITDVLKPNEQKCNETEYQGNINVSLSTKTDNPIANIAEKSVDKEDNPINYELNNLSADLQTDDSDEHDVLGLNLQELEPKMTVASTCENEELLFSATEVENIIIDDPEGLFETSDLSCSTNTTDIQPKILASGALNSEIVDLSLSKGIPVSVEIKYPSDKNDNSNNIKLDIQLMNQKQDNIFNKEDICDLEIPKTNNVQEKEKIKLHNLKKIDEVKIIEEPVTNKENTRKELYYADIEKKIEKNIEKKNKLPGRSKNKTVSDHLKLPSVGDIDTDFRLRIKKTDFESVFKSKLKICTSKKPEQQEFCFPKSIVQEALETAKEDVNKIRPKKNKSLVNLLLGENKKKTCYTNKDSPTAFDGFKFSSKIIKTASSSTKKKTELIIEGHSKDKLDKSNCNIKLNNTNLVQKQLTTVENNVCVSGESVNFNSNFGDEALNEFFDNIDDPEQINSPNSNENVTEFEELLKSLCH